MNLYVIWFKLEYMPVTKGVANHGWSGTLNKEVVFRQRNGKTVVSVYPDMSNVVRTEKQRKVNTIMQEANYYAQVITGDEKERMEAQFRLDVPSNKLFTALIKEYFAKHHVKEGTKREKKKKEVSLESLNAVVKRFIDAGRSPEDIAKLTGAELVSVLALKKKIEEGLKK